MKLIKMPGGFVLVDVPSILKIGDWYLGEGFLGPGIYQWSESQQKQYGDYKAPKLLQSTYPVSGYNYGPNGKLVSIPNGLNYVDIDAIALRYSNKYEHCSIEERRYRNRGFAAGYIQAMQDQFESTTSQSKLEWDVEFDQFGELTILN